jgi:hypothetical protein
MSEKPEKQEAVAGVGILVAAFTNEEAGEEAQEPETSIFRRRSGDPPGR